jgi:hypothetical protein
MMNKSVSVLEGEGGGGEENSKTIEGGVVGEDGEITLGKGKEGEITLGKGKDEEITLGKGKDGEITLGKGKDREITLEKTGGKSGKSFSKKKITRGKKEKKKMQVDEEG